MKIYQIIRTYHINNQLYRLIIDHNTDREYIIQRKNLFNKNADKSIMEYFYVELIESGI